MTHIAAPAASVSQESHLAWPRESTRLSSLDIHHRLKTCSTSGHRQGRVDPSPPVALGLAYGFASSWMRLDVSQRLPPRSWTRW
jgi:hypothetical protein